MSLPHRLPRVRGVNVGDLGTCQGSREPPYALRWSSGLTQSLSQRSHVAYALPHPPPRGDRLSGVPAMLCGPLGRNASGSALSRSRRANGMPSGAWRPTPPPPDRAAPGNVRSPPPLSRPGTPPGGPAALDSATAFVLRFVLRIPPTPP